MGHTGYKFTKKNLSWRGNYDDFENLLTAVLERFEHDFTAYEAAYKDQLATELAKHDDKSTDTEEQKRRNAAGREHTKSYLERIRAIDSEGSGVLRVSATSSPGVSIVSKGSPREIAEELRKTSSLPTSIYIRGLTASSSQITITLDSVDAIEITVTSDDEKWARNSFRVIVAAVQEQRPGWAFIRGGRRVPAVSVMILVAAGALLRTLWDAEQPDSLAIISVAVFMLAVCLSFVSLWAIDWLVPAFSLAGSRKDRTRSTFAAAAGVVFLGLVASVLYGFVQIMFF